MPTPTLTYGLGNSTTSSLSDGLSWPLHCQLPASMATALQEQVPVPGGPIIPYPEQLAWIFDPGQFSSAPLQYTPADWGGPGEIVPYSAANFVGLNGPPVEPTLPAGWVPGGPHHSIPSAAPAPVPDVATSPQMTVGIRQRGEDDTLHGQRTSDGHRPSLRKKCKTTVATRTGISCHLVESSVSLIKGVCATELPVALSMTRARMRLRSTRPCCAQRSRGLGDGIAQPCKFGLGIRRPGCMR